MSAPVTSEAHKRTIEQFYQSFANADAEGMIKCYDDHVTFYDPVFGSLEGERAKNMWRMLISRSKGNISIQYSDVSANENTGKANWVATYNFGQTGRKVVNKIAASFVFKGDKIIEHTDLFSVWKWSRQALGVSGFLLGWSSLLRNKIHKKALAQLNAYGSK